jgi:predicted CoA-substrate-specific enzyme activase
MKYAGIDIGSRTMELVVVEDGQICLSKEADTGFDPVAGARQILEGVEYDQIMATGYGRHLFEMSFDHASTVTEIKAHAQGAYALFQNKGMIIDNACILDIGGQDSKAIALYKNGRVRKFEMNDRCAAGTGKFLEIMAKTLGYSIDEFGPAALEADGHPDINSMCTVFAESEVTSLIARGTDRKEIAKALHISVAKRAASMIGRISSDGPVIFSGGAARNPCLVTLISKQLRRKALVPRYPHMTGAIGAALILSEQSQKKKQEFTDCP